jgi:hypothetical protein
MLEKVCKITDLLRHADSADKTRAPQVGALACI